MENLRNKKIKLDNPIKKDIQISSLIEGKFNEYKINIYELLLNPYNDRFAKEKSKNEKLDENNPDEVLFSKEVQELIDTLIWNINTKRNNKTLKNIEELGIQKPIVIDASGLIIDGNRRVIISRKILKSKNLNLEKRIKLEKINCRVIPKILDKETIFEYETKLQMAEDKPLDYDPINVYLKINKLLKQKNHLKNEDEKYRQVAQLMGTEYSKKNIKTSKETFDIMEDYLNLIGKENNYMELVYREDHLKQFAMFWNKLEKNKFKNSNFNFEDKNNQFDIRKICYALINQQFEGKKFRKIFPKEKNPSGPLTSKRSLEYLKEKLKINNKNYEDLKKMANNKDSKFSKAILEKIVETSKEISFNVNNEDNQDIESFIKDTLKKINKLNNMFEDAKNKNSNKRFLKEIEKIKYKINEIILGLKKDKY